MNATEFRILLSDKKPIRNAKEEDFIENQATRERTANEIPLKNLLWVCVCVSFVPTRPHIQEVAPNTKQIIVWFVVFKLKNQKKKIEAKYINIRCSPSSKIKAETKTRTAFSLRSSIEFNLAPFFVCVCVFTIRDSFFLKFPKGKNVLSVIILKKRLASKTIYFERKMCVCVFLREIVYLSVLPGSIRWIWV